MSVATKKQRKAEALEGILETMETDGVVEDWILKMLMILCVNRTVEKIWTLMLFVEGTTYQLN